MSKTLSQTLNENKMRKGYAILAKNALRAVLRRFSGVLGIKYRAMK